jgi:hypothetical protein
LTVGQFIDLIYNENTIINKIDD